jgi:hypothetical protein
MKAPLRIALGLAAILGVSACENREPARLDDTFPAAGTEQPTPQTTAPGYPAPGVDPVPRTAPGVIQDDTLAHPGQPPAEVPPGI